MKKTFALLTVIAVMFTLLCLPPAANAASLVSGDYKYNVSDDGTVEIAKYTGSAGEVEIPSEIDGKPVRKIGKRCFYRNMSIKKAIIPDGVTEIDDFAFWVCENLTEAVIPDTVEKLGFGAFSDTGLKSFTVPPLVTEIPDSLLSLTDITELTIPETVKVIGDGAFSLTKIKSVIIPETVEKIECFAFNDCPELEEVQINAELKALPGYAFSDCKKLRSVALPESLTEVGSSAFRNCKSLSSVELPDGVTKISTGAFSGSGLESFHVSKNIEKISGILYTPKLKEITVDGDHEKYTAFKNVLYNKSKTKLIMYPAGREDKSLKLIPSVKKLGAGCFYRAENLEKLAFNSGLKMIDDCAFSYSGIKKLTVPKTVKSIGEQAFGNCGKLESLKFKTTKNIFIDRFLCYNSKNLKYAEIPKMSEYGGEGMFDGCKRLEKVKVLKGVKQAGAEFYGCNKVKTFIVPSSVKKITGAPGYRLEFDSKKNKTLKHKIKGFTVKAKKNSAANKYAKKHGFKFAEINY